MINKITIDGFDIQVWTTVLEQNPVVAVNMTESIQLLEGYDLTDEEKSDVTELLSGYCRLIDERRLCGYGDTEFEAIKDLFSHAKRVTE